MSKNANRDSISTVSQNSESVKKEPATIGGRIKQLRMNNGITQERLKEMLGMANDSTRISKLENDHTEPNCWELVELSKIFQKTTDYILRGNIEAGSFISVTPEDKAFFSTWITKILSC